MESSNEGAFLEISRIKILHIGYNRQYHDARNGLGRSPAVFPKGGLDLNWLHSLVR